MSSERYEVRRYQLVMLDGMYRHAIVDRVREPGFEHVICRCGTREYAELVRDALNESDLKEDEAA